MASSWSSSPWCLTTACPSRRIVSGTGFAGGFGARDEVHEPVDAEAFAAGGVHRLDDAVGVEHQTVTRLERFLVHVEGVVQPDAERSVRRPRELLDDPALPQQQGRRMPGDDPSQSPGSEVELRDDRGDEASTAELGGERSFDHDHGLAERKRTAAGVAIRATATDASSAASRPCPMASKIATCATPSPSA